MVERCGRPLQGINADVIDLRTLRRGIAKPCSRRSTHPSVPDRARGSLGTAVLAPRSPRWSPTKRSSIRRARRARDDAGHPEPHHPDLMEWALPSVERIRAKIEELVAF